MAKDTAGSAVWTIGKLVQAVRGDSSGGVKIEIPKFQRHLVWSDQQRKELIDSVHRGFPIGAILLYRRPGAHGGAEVHQVIDGLQRTSTLVTYAEHPLRLAPVNLFPENRVVEVSKTLSSEPEHVRRAIRDWMNETGDLKFQSGFRPDGLAKYLCINLAVSEPHPVAELTDVLAVALDELVAAVEISAVSLPVVTYSGPEGDLPEIFERINQGGTKLSKYEVFAASWIHAETQVNSEEIRVAINDKYSALISRGFSISGLESDKPIQDFNLFEYLFGLGKTLVKAQPLLFNAKDDPAETEPVAFSLTCVALGQQLSAMSSLPSSMPRAADGVIDPTKLEAAIKVAAAEVEKWLAPYIGLRLNSGGSGLDIAHGELQIVSMIARAIAGRWRSESDWSEREEWKEDWKRLRDAMPQHYLMDLLEETWRGPIYSLIYARVWEQDETDKSLRPAQRYARKIDRKTWDNALDSWFAKQLAREQRSRPYVRSVDRAFLRFVYTGLVSHLDDKGTDFELEHLFPVSRLKSEIPPDGPGWPISCVANLALFTKSLNREKSAKTISEYLTEAKLGAKDDELLRKFLLCQPEEVSISSGGLEREEYVTFLNGRWVTMKDRLYVALQVEAIDGKAQDS